MNTPTGEQIPNKERIKYLGCLLSSDGKIGTELNNRLGMAQADFKTLDKVWAHTVINRHRKSEIFEACILSKPLYGLNTAWLSQAESNKVDAFHVKCLRHIAKIQHSCYSHVSNQSARDTFGVQALSVTLLEQ